MADPLLDAFHIHPLVDEDGDTGRAQAVEGDALRKVRHGLQGLGEGLCQVIRIIERAVGVLEDIVVLLVAVAAELSIILFLLLQMPEHFDLAVVERVLTGTCGRLRRVQAVDAGALGDRVADGHGLFIEINGRPLEPQDLLPPEAEKESNVEDLKQGIVPRTLQEALGFLVREEAVFCLFLHRIAGNQLSADHDLPDRVVGDDSVLYGQIHGVSEEDLDVLNGPGLQEIFLKQAVEKVLHHAFFQIPDPGGTEVFLDMLALVEVGGIGGVRHIAVLLCKGVIDVVSDCHIQIHRLPGALLQELFPFFLGLPDVFRGIGQPGRNPLLFEGLDAVFHDRL